MADIKFMDLSENGNPATTDSVLIGNSQDGLKRTTLGTIGNMFAVHGALHFERVALHANTASSQIPSSAGTEYSVQYPIQAPEVSGYTFECWVASSVNGFCRATYVDNPLGSSATMWVVNPSVSSIKDPNTMVSAIALYVKNELA